MTKWLMISRYGTLPTGIMKKSPPTIVDKVTPPYWTMPFSARGIGTFYELLEPELAHAVSRVMGALLVEGWPLAFLEAN